MFYNYRLLLYSCIDTGRVKLYWRDCGTQSQQSNMTLRPYVVEHVLCRVI